MDKKELTTWELMRRLTALVKHLCLPYVLAVGGAVLGFCTTILIPAIIINLAWRALEGQTPSLIWLIVLLSLGFLRGFFRYVEHFFGYYVAFKTLYDFRCMVFSKLRRLAPAKLDHQDSGQLLKMIGEDIEAMEVFFAHTLPPIMTASIVTLILIVYFVTVSPFIALIALFTYVILAILLPQYSARRLQPLLKSQSQTRTKYMSKFSDSLHGMKELLQFGQIEKRLIELEADSQSVNAREKDVTVAQYLQTISTFLVIGLAILCISSLAFRMVVSHRLDLSVAVTSIVIFTTSFAPYLELSRLPLGFKRAMNAARQVFTLLDEEEFDKSGQIFNQSIDRIQLEDLSFSYPNRDQVIFESLSLVFENHKIIGLVGPSGSGKSTLMKLIMKWYETTKGSIKINQKNLSSLSGRDVQNRIAYIPQIPQLFSQTIRDNLTLGKPDISDDMILEVAMKCQIKDRILATEKGLDTVINSEQNIFSSGEQQRLELTRALLKNADCYIFDEPTSNLDSLNEAAFLHLIREHCHGYVFLISHRLSTVSCCDKIYKVSQKKLQPF